MGIVVQFPRHARASAGSAGYKSGRKSDLETPVSRSIAKTCLPGTPCLDFVSQYQICDCVVPIRRASLDCPPAASHARCSASVVDMGPPYPNLGENQPKTLSGTGHLIIGRFRPMGREVDPHDFGRRILQRRESLKLSQDDLAAAVGQGTKQQTVDNWEHGKVKRPRVLLEIAKALRTSQEWLLYGEGSEELTVDEFWRLMSPDERELAIRLYRATKERAA